MRRAGVLRGKCLAYWVLLGVVTVRASFARNPVFRGVLFLYGNAAHRPPPAAALYFVRRNPKNLGVLCKEKPPRKAA